MKHSHQVAAKILYVHRIEDLPDPVIEFHLSEMRAPGREIGRVSLVTNQDGCLDIWGDSMDRWASDGVILWVDGRAHSQDERRELIDTILFAAQEEHDEHYAEWENWKRAQREQCSASRSHSTRPQL